MNIRTISKALLGKLLRQGGAHMGFSEHIDTILNGTELWVSVTSHYLPDLTASVTGGSQFWQVTSVSCSLMRWYAGMSCSFIWRYADMHVDCGCCFSFRWISVLNNAKEEVLLKAFHDTSDSHSLNQSVRELTSSIVDRICKLPGNKYCCDCDAPGWGWIFVLFLLFVF